MVHSLNGGSKDITQLVTNVKWKGAREEVARSVEFSYVSSPNDKFLPKVQVELGNMIYLHDDDGSELFRGYVFFREKAHNSDEVVIRCYDLMIYLTKSKAVYNFKNQTAEGIVKKICGDVGVATGEIVSTGIKFSKVFTGNTYYEMMITAYTEAHKKNGKKYIILSQKGKLLALEKGTNKVSIVLSNYNERTNEGNIVEAKYSESIENMVSRVIITDTKGKKIGEVKDDNLLKLYGTIQEVYQKEKDKEATPIAKSLLKGVERTANIEALGNVECITGNAVEIEDSYTGLVGKFFIEADEHTWENGNHKMSLVLSFDNLMDTKG